MRLAGREISAELLKELQQRAPDCSRRALAREWCAREGWISSCGQPATMAARKALAELTRRGHLPPPRRGPPPRRQRRAGPPAPCAPIAGELASLGPLEFILLPAGSSALSRAWNELLDQFHYLGAGPLCGAQLRYLVRSAQGPVAALAFSAAAWRVAARDQWIGWTDEQRRENLPLVVNNSRWLIPAHVQVPNLASHVLGHVLARLPADWQQRYGYTPVLVETFVEHGRFHGGGYQADSLESCLAIDLVAAWRIYHLTKLGRETPDVPCTVNFADHEWQALVAAVHRDAKAVPAEPPSLRGAMRMVASLGGFLGRKADGEPGTQTLWLGLQRLDDIVLGWCLRSDDPVLQKQAVARLRKLMVFSNPEYG